MRKHKQTKSTLRLSTQTVRTLADAELAGAAGAYNTFSCIRSCGNTCWATCQVTCHPV
jgi:hypothetical protein